MTIRAENDLRLMLRCPEGLHGYVRTFARALVDTDLKE
jgi:hypothetical protein